MKAIIALLLLILAIPGCRDDSLNAPIAPAAKESQKASQKSPGGHQRATPVMGACQVFNVKLEEISGLCLNQDTTGFWAVSDEGHVCQVTFQGAVNPILSTGLDMEGVTLNPATGDMYVAVEGDQMVCRLQAPGYTVVDTLFYVQEAITEDFDNNGLEGIAFYKDSLLLVGSQEDAIVWTYRLDGTLVSRVSLRKETSKIEEVAGLFYDAKKDWLWVSDSDTQRLFIFKVGTFDLVASYDVPFIDNAEAICVDRAHDCVWVGSDEDDPKLYRISFSF